MDIHIGLNYVTWGLMTAAERQQWIIELGELALKVGYLGAIKIDLLATGVGGER